MKKNGFLKILFLFLLLLMIPVMGYLQESSASAQVNGDEDKDEGVVLQSRKLMAPPGRSQALKDLKEIPPGLGKHVIVQLDRIPNATERLSLADSGIKLVQYIHNRGWYASVSGDFDISSPQLERVRGSWSIQPSDRLAPMLQQGEIPDHAVTPDGYYVLTVLAFEDVELQSLKKKIESYGAEVYSISSAFNTLFLQVPPYILQEIANLDEVQWIEPVAPPLVPEMNRARVYLHTDLAQAAPYNLNGSGVLVSVHDEGHAFRHQDFYSRWIQGDDDALTVIRHATTTAGTIAGDGTFNSTYKGMAPRATIVTYASPIVVGGEANLYGDIADALTRGVDIANNSWGYGGCTVLPWGNYTSQARVFDQEVLGRNSTGSVIGSPTVVVFSAGNERNNTACVTNDTAPFANYGTINQPKPAKNLIVVGGVDSYNNMMSTFSSWGPTRDGRLKPDIVAPALHNGTNSSGVSDAADQYGDLPYYTNGDFYRAPGEFNTNNSATTYDDRYMWYGMTSAAAAMVSGNAALFIQDFRAQNSNNNPLPSTVKAHFIHTARDLNDSTSWYNPGPDYASGYGVLDIKAAIDQLRSKGWTEGCVEHGEVDNYSFVIPTGTLQVKATLVWDDVPASPGTTAPALVNDLDLIVVDPVTEMRRYPWTLNPAAPSASAVRTAEDHLNNVEMVLVDGTVPSGIWYVAVKGTSVPSGPQCYSLVVSPVGLPSVNISATDNTAIEGGLRPNRGTFTVSRTGFTHSPLTVYYSVGGTAAGGRDYTALPGSVTIPAGVSSAAINVTPINDTLMEADEIVVLTLSANAAYIVGTPSRSTVTIVSDEGLVTPPDGFTSSGPQGGPFTPSSKTYTLTNPSTISITWKATKGMPFTKLSRTSGILGPRASTTVTVSIDSNATISLPGVGTYGDTVTFTNTTNGIGNTTRPVTLTITTPPPPTASARVEIDHTYRGDLVVTVGVGNVNAPSWSTVVSNRAGQSADNLYVDVNISAGAAYLPPSSTNVWFLKVSDMEGGDTGTIKTFRITSGGTTYTSTNPPVAIPDNQTVYAYIGGTAPPPGTTVTLGATYSTEVNNSGTKFYHDGNDWVGRSSSGILRAANRWDISGINPSWTITSVEVRFYVESKTGSTGALSINRYGSSHGEDNPESDTGTTAYSKIAGAAYASLPEPTSGSWTNWVNLGSSAASDIAWCRDNSKTIWSVGLKASSTVESSTTVRHVDFSEDNETNDAELRVTYTQ